MQYRKPMSVPNHSPASTISTQHSGHSNASQCVWFSCHQKLCTLLNCIRPVNGLGINMVSCTGEFVMAQTPNRMRGILGITIAVLAYFQQCVTWRLFQLFNSATPSCGFYYYLVVSLLILLVHHTAVVLQSDTS